MYMIHNLDILLATLKRQPKLGADPTNIDESAQKSRDLSRELEDIKKASDDALGTIKDNYLKVYDAFNNVNLQLGVGLSKMSGLFDKYATAMVDLVKESTFLEQRNKSLNKSFGMSSLKVAELGQKYDEMAESLGTGGEAIRKYGENVNKMLPGMSKMIMGTNDASKGAKNFDKDFKTALLGANQLLTEHFGLSEDNANNYQLYAAGMGESSVEMMKATQAWAEKFDEATGMAGSFSTILSEISDLGSDVQMQYSRYPGSLEKAVVKAKILGTTFKQIEAMASKMLNIEESVGQELEYQLLSGKRLVGLDGQSITEKLRIAKLTGNAEDQVKAMNELLETQGDVLDGNNHYAKEQLANLTGFTVAELTRQRQTRKLMEQGGMDEAEIGKLMDMDPADFAKALEGKSADVVEALKSLKQAESQQTTDEKFGDLLDKERTEGIRIVAGNQYNAISGASTAAMNATGPAADYGRQFLSKPLVETLGKTQTLGLVFDATLKPVEGLVEMLPIANTALNTFTANVKKFKETILGTEGASGRTDKQVVTTDIKDGIIQFDPADKFASLSGGATLLASTSYGQLGEAAKTLMGQNGAAVVDPAPIATAVATAIQTALAGMKIEMDGEKLNKAMEFGNRTVN